jgi:translation initiation factor RLI1
MKIEKPLWQKLPLKKDEIMEKQEILKLQNYLRKLFGNEALRVVARPKLKDSVEVYIDEEFIAVINKDIDEGEVSYDFAMAILEEDL